MKIGSFIFCVLLLGALLIPRYAFASTDGNSPSTNNNQSSFQTLTNQVTSFFSGNTTAPASGISSSDTNYTNCGSTSSGTNYTNCGSTSSGTNYTNCASGSNCENSQSPPSCDSNQLWSEWYCGGGQWGCF